MTLELKGVLAYVEQDVRLKLPSSPECFPQFNYFPMTVLIKCLDSNWVFCEESLGDLGCCLTNGLVGGYYSEDKWPQSINCRGLASQFI
jgi:hypothetical protein